MRKGPEIDPELKAYAVNKLGNKDAPVVKAKLFPVPSPKQHTNIEISTYHTFAGSVISRNIKGKVNTATQN